MRDLLEWTPKRTVPHSTRRSRFRAPCSASPDGAETRVFWCIPFLLAAVFCCPTLWATDSPLVITEFMASNSTVLADEEGEYPDWLEIFNRSDAPVELAGWRLTDDANDLDGWRFPAMTLGPGEFLLVFASGNDRRDPQAPLHTDFRLSVNGEYLALIDPDRAVAHEFAPGYPEQATDVAAGLVITQTKNSF